MPIDRRESDAPPPGGRPPRLTEFLRERRTAILNAWISAVQRLPVARSLERPALLDHIPEILDRIADLADQLHAGVATELPHALAELHAVARLHEGFDLAQVIGELAVLRECIMRQWEEVVGQTTLLHDLRILDRAIDSTITASTDRYTQARDRTLRALDRIATAAFESRGVDDLLRRLLRVLLDTTASVDTAAILLCEGNLVRVRAAVGLGREMEEGFSMRIGEGFAGTIAATGQPLARDSLSMEPVPMSPILRNSGLGALYGVPLVQDGKVIGVAHMGSMSAHVFSDQDKQLFAALAARATAAIHQHVLYETAQRTAAELHARELELRTLTDNMPQLAWIADPSGARSWFNRRWTDYTGQPPEAAQRWGWQAMHHPAHAPRVLATYRSAMASGEIWEDTYPLRGRDGRYRWFLSRALPVREGGQIVRWFGTNTDVTSQRFLAGATEVLASSLHYEDKLEQVAQLAVPDLADWCVVDLLDDHGGVRRVALAHADPAKLEFATRWVRAHPPDWSASEGHARVLRTGEPIFVPHITDEILQRIARDPEHLRGLRTLGLTSYLMVPLRGTDQVLGVITLLREDGARDHDAGDLEVALELGRRAGRAIDHARLYREARQASKLRERVLAIVSHDLRSPLSAIDLGTGRLSERFATDPRARKYLGIIRRSSEHMNQMIGDLLDMASIEAGKLALDREPQDVRELLDESVELHEPLAIEKGLSIERAYLLDGEQVLADRGRIAQVLGNLLGNAKKFCAPGDVITVRARRVGDDVEIVVEDTGPGIPAANLPRVFDLFWSAKGHAAHGAGLGLYICKGLVEAHGGTIRADPDVTRGARFVIRLPLERAHPIGGGGTNPSTTYT